MNENATATTPWNTHDGKVEIFQKVMKYLHDNPTEYTRCLECQAGRDIVIAACKTMATPLEIPSDARVVFLPPGDNLRGDPRPPPFVPPAGLSAPLAELSAPAAEPSVPPAEPFMFGGGIPFNAGSSLIITLPPWQLIHDKPEDPLLLAYACSYIIW